MAKAKAEAEATQVPASFEDVLAAKPKRADSTGDRLGLYLVITGPGAQIVRAALQKVGETNHAAYIQRLVREDLKARLNGKQ